MTRCLRFYDTTGREKEQPIEDKVRAILAEGFMDALTKDVPQIVEHVRKLCEGKIAESRKQIGQMEAAISKFQSRRAKVKTRGGTQNLFRNLIDQQIPQLKQGVEAHKQNVEAFEAALAMLEKYDEDVPTVQLAQFVYFNATT